MHISGLTGSQVWLSSSRSLTNFGSGALANTGISQTSLAGAANVDLRPSAGIIAVSTISVQTGAAATGSIDIKIQDGINIIILASTAAAANAHQFVMSVNCNPQGFQIGNNDATNAGKYIMASYSMTI